MKIEDSKALFVLGENMFHIKHGIVLTEECIVGEDEPFLTGDEITFNCNSHTQEWCKSPQHKVIAASFELKGTVRLILMPLDNVFPCIITATGQEGWKYYFNDANGLNKHSRFFVSEDECRNEAKRHLFPNATFTKSDLERFFEIVKSEHIDYDDGIVSGHSFGSCLIKLMKESRTNWPTTLELDIETLDDEKWEKKRIKVGFSDKNWNEIKALAKPILKKNEIGNISIYI
ncbi:MAG: hypothetical protein AABY15_02960 [Nanoarchaeota archaeon]